MASDTFTDLLARLGEYHERSLEKLRKENARLVQELHKSQPRKDVEDCDTRSHLEEEESCSTSMPLHIPGVPTEVVRPPPRATEPPRSGDILRRSDTPNRSSSNLSSISRLAWQTRQRSTKSVTTGTAVREPSAVSLKPSAIVPNFSDRDWALRLSTTDNTPHNKRPSGRKLKGNGLEKAVADLQTQNLSKQKQRFRQLLDLRGDLVTPHCLMKALQKRGRADYCIEQARSVVQELKEIRPGREFSLVMATPSTSGIGIDLESFVQLIVPDFNVEQPGVSAAVQEVQKVLLPQAVDEVIGKVTKTQVVTASSVVRMVSVGDQVGTRGNRQMTLLNAIVGAVVVMSITTLGVSTDVNPDWKGWIVLEVFFGIVFVAEVVIKIHLLGLHRYLSGPGWRWNWFDVFVTMLSLVDLTISLVSLGGKGETGVSGVQLSMVLRAFRLARIVRLVKLLHTPILADLANMLAGFQVGVPCLLWVMVLLFIIFYVVGMILRQLVGPAHGESLIDVCGGTGDTIGESSDPLCQPHILYGEEFFGTLRGSMFTVFRCVFSDCSTRAGKSLTATFSHGYGVVFDILHCCGMVLVVVGLFNIIAAIFVETTISGLKYNNVQRKYARTYESRYVQQRLEALVARIQELYLEAGHEHFCHNMDEFVLNEDEFDEVMQDDGVNSILEDLDVVLSNRVGLFDMFDSDNNGLVNISELVSTLMKVRGEPQKSDMIASWVALRSLSERFQGFERLVLENQKRLMDNQMELLAK